MVNINFNSSKTVGLHFFGAGEYCKKAICWNIGSSAHQREPPSVHHILVYHGDRRGFAPVSD